MTNPIETWLNFLKNPDSGTLDSILADEVEFHSPVVYKAQSGKNITSLYLQAAISVLGNDTFRYVRKIIGENDAVLEFIVTVDELEINGVDLIRWGADGKITDFKVMIRPLKAVNKIHQLMAEKLMSTQKAMGRKD